MTTRLRLCSVIGAAMLGYAAFGASPALAEESRPASEEPNLTTENTTPVICKPVRNVWVCFPLKSPH